MFNGLRLSLKAHMEAEETSLYPAMNDQEREMVLHATEEHLWIDRMLTEIGRSDLEGEAFIDSIEDLASVIDDHVLEEEEIMILRARQMFDQARIDQLSVKFDEVDERIAQRAN